MKFDYCFVDLDDTIFNTKKFKDDIYKVFSPLGITRADFTHAYRSAAELKKMGYFHYTFEKQIESVRLAGYPAGRKELLALNNLLKNDYRKAGAIDFVKYLQTVCDKVILLTAGTKDFQAKKVKALKIAGLFDKIIQISGGKDKILRPYILRKKQILFINDNLEENLMIKKLFTKINVLTLFNSSYWKVGDCKKSKIPYFKNYNQMKKYISKYELR